MATPERRSGIAGISVGGLIVIAGILLMIFWSLWIGLIVVLVGLIAFGGDRRECRRMADPPGPAASATTNG
jgi:hypothetical protein